MQLTYKGPHEAVEVPDFGLLAERGETIDVPEDAVADLCALADLSDVADSIGWVPADDEARDVLADAIETARAPEPDEPPSDSAGIADDGQVDDDPEPPEDYPTDGTVKDVLTWVHAAEDIAALRDRARVAHTIEQANDEPRTSLLSELEALAGDEGEQA